MDFSFHLVKSLGPNEWNWGVENFNLILLAICITLMSTAVETVMKEELINNERFSQSRQLLKQKRNPSWIQFVYNIWLKIMLPCISALSLLFLRQWLWGEVAPKSHETLSTLYHSLGSGRSPHLHSKWKKYKAMLIRSI